MKKVTLWAVIALMMTTSITGCSGDEDTVVPKVEHEETPSGDEQEGNELADITLTRAEEKLVKGSNDFAFNLFRQTLLAEDAGTASLRDASAILSPISITYALGMLNNGAAGVTQEQINNMLGFGKEGADSINAFCKKMLTKAPGLDKLTKVMIANTIFVNNKFQLEDAFVQKAREYYGGTPETRDFTDGKTLDAINQWASDHTEKMIDKVLDKDSFDPTAVSYLLNVIYFKGTWTLKFNKEETQDEIFYTYSKQNNPKMPMMHLKSEFNYADYEDFQVLCLPYGNKAYSMTLFLPREGKTIDNVLKALDATSWERYRNLGSATVDVKLPRFELKSDVKLNGIMARLGMPKAFTTSAEFPYFCNVPTYIGLMKQVARIKLNEEGTEAAAVTVIGMKDYSIGGEGGEKIFHANRPFLYVISEQSTGAVFFIGQYMGN